MKTNIHPNWHNDAVVTCSCGNTFKTGSTEPAIKVDICSKCHPFFTGEMKFVDQQGRVEKFQAKQANARKAQAKNKTTKSGNQQAPQSLKEMLTAIKKQSEAGNQ